MWVRASVLYVHELMCILVQMQLTWSLCSGMKIERNFPYIFIIVSTTLLYSEFMQESSQSAALAQKVAFTSSSVLWMHSLTGRVKKHCI